MEMKYYKEESGYYLTEPEFEQVDIGPFPTIMDLIAYYNDNYFTNNKIISSLQESIIPPFIRTSEDRQNYVRR